MCSCAAFVCPLITLTLKVCTALQVIGTDELRKVLGERPFKKSVEWDEFINASWQKSRDKSDAGDSTGAATPEEPVPAMPAV